MKHKEGYIKFQCNWKKETFNFPDSIYEELEQARSYLWSRNLIGMYPDGIGFGNISNRFKTAFIISGSATGKHKNLLKSHYALVNEYNYHKNQLTCTGEIKASSESLSHAAIYEANDNIQAVTHIHSKNLWDKYKDIYPTTSYSAEYGTPEIAIALKQTAEKKPDNGIIIMGGHVEGIIIYSSSIKGNIKLINQLL